ncbi:DNA/RNA non-specific endonuclease [Acinetobacter baumannii]|nr:DNA/RNA non-specific endonuclease [Acinetobacter baumannii]
MFNVSGDNGEYLIASLLRGAGDINLVPQASTLDCEDWKAMERQLANGLRAERLPRLEE